MQRRGQCKFYAQGKCLKGESCDFAHGLKMNHGTKACIYYQRGTCTYGSRCRFEHSNSSSMTSFAPSSSCSRGSATSNRLPLCISSGVAVAGTAQNPSLSTALSGLSIADAPTVKPEIHVGNSSESGRNDRMICSLAADGNCPHGETCADIHGDLCSTCGKYCLHPSKPEDRENHAKECEKKKALVERSQEIECSVCLERILSKSIVAERKFGLLAECDHAFCISCIKKWRSCSSSLEMDDDNARACPVCRKLSYYIIPSPIWYSSKDEKQEIIKKYKAKLKSIDCRYFNFGSGRCLHGRNCFYKHEVKPGSSRRNRSSNARYRHKNRQYGGRWDDDPLGFGDFADMSDMVAMLELFGELCHPGEEEVGDGEDVMDFFKELHEQEMRSSGDHDEEDIMDFIKRMREQQMGSSGNNDEEDEMDYLKNLYEQGFFFSGENDEEDGMDFVKKLYKHQMIMSGDYDEEDFLEPWQKEFLYAQMGYDSDEIDYYCGYDLDDHFGDDTI